MGHSRYESPKALNWRLLLCRKSFRGSQVNCIGKAISMAQLGRLSYFVTCFGTIITIKIIFYTQISTNFSLLS